MNVSICAGHALRTPYRFHEEASEAARAEAAEASSGSGFEPLLLTVHIKAMARACRIDAFAGLLSRRLTGERG